MDSIISDRQIISLKEVFLSGYTDMKTHWWKVILIYLILIACIAIPLIAVAVFITLIIGGELSGSIYSYTAIGILTLLTIFISFILSYSAVKILLSTTGENKILLKDLLFGFYHKKRAIALPLISFLVIIPWWSLLMMIAGARIGTFVQEEIVIAAFGIIAGIAMIVEFVWRYSKYNLLPWLTIENEEEGIWSLKNKSAQMMRGNKEPFIYIFLIFTFAILPLEIIGELLGKTMAGDIVLFISTIAGICISFFASFCYPVFYKKVQIKNASNTQAEDTI